MCMYVCMCVCMYVCVYVCVHVCMYVYITHTNTHTHTHSHTHTHTHTHTQGHCAKLLPLIIHALPRAKHLFLYRSPLKTVQSMTRAFSSEAEHLVRGPLLQVRFCFEFLKYFSASSSPAHLWQVFGLFLFAFFPFSSFSTSSSLAPLTSSSCLLQWQWVRAIYRTRASALTGFFFWRTYDMYALSRLGSCL